MISFPPRTKIVVIVEPVSFAGGIDKFRGLAVEITKNDPFENGYFLFISKVKKQVRVLWYDGQGFVLSNKRLSAGVYKNWPKTKQESFLII